MKPIKKIILPIDFSVTSRNAFQYALNFANEIGANITLVHIKESPFPTSDTSVMPTTNQVDSNVLQSMKEFMEEENTNSLKVNIAIEMYEGNVVEQLINLSKTSDVDLIVVGNTGLSDVLTKVFGSTTHQLSTKANCPVIIVPRGVKWQPIYKLVYASNYDSMLPQTIKEMTSIAEIFSANIHFVNVKNYDPLFETKQTEVNWNELLILANPNLQFEKHTIYGNDTVLELKNYCELHTIDMLVFASKQRNFWQNLIHKSVTDNSVFSSTIPIMVLHFNDNV